YRYQIGSDIRRKATDVLHTANRAWRDRAHQRRWVEQVVWAIDELKQYLRTAMQIHAFKSFRQFEHIIRQAESLGAQAGGWRRQLHA
ncbi:four helix bundle protein, partial [Planococcus sp. SIMBA_160]